MVLVLSSCTMEKRHYNSGYSVNWKHDKKAKKSLATATEEKTEIAAEKAQIIETETSSIIVNEEKAVENNAEAQISTEETALLVSSNTDNAIVLPAKSVLKRYKQANSNYNFLTSEKIVKNSDVRENKAANKDLASPTNTKGGNKSWILALLLCFFLGYLGLHRFYLGYPGIGILMLFTGGVFGILWLIDFIRILTQSLKPKDGDCN